MIGASPNYQETDTELKRLAHVTVHIIHPYMYVIP